MPRTARGRSTATMSRTERERSTSPLARHQNREAVRTATSHVSDNLASGLATLLDNAVEGPLQRAFKEIDLRFEQLTDANDDLQARVARLEADNNRLQSELDGVPLATELSKLEEENARLRADMEKEVRQRHLETEEVNTVLKQVSLFVELLDGQNSRQRRHRVESTLRGTVVRMQKAKMANAWNAWKQIWAHKRRVRHLTLRAQMCFKNRLFAQSFYTWQSWARMSVKEALKGNQGVGKAFSDLKQQMETEVAQRHYEVEQIHVVMKQLSFLLESSDAARTRERAHQIESTMKSALHRMSHTRLGAAFSAWLADCNGAKRRRNVLAKVAARWQHKTLVKCFASLAAHVMSRRAQKKETTLESMASELAETKRMAQRTTDGIEDLVRDSVTHMYYQTSEAQRQAKIQRSMRRVYVRLTKQLLVMAFAAWKFQWAHTRRLSNLRGKALARFRNLCVAKCFQPWAAMARQTFKDRQEATVLSNFDQLTRCDARIEEMHRSLMKIFTSGSDGVYSA